MHSTRLREGCHRTHRFCSPSTVPLRLAFTPPASLIFFFCSSRRNHLTVALSPPLAMAMWSRSNTRRKELDALVVAGLLCPFTEEGQKWLLSKATTDRPVPLPGYIVSFIPFHGRGVGSSGSDYF